MSFTERDQALFLQVLIDVCCDLRHLPVRMRIDGIQHQPPGPDHQLPGGLGAALGRDQSPHALLPEALPRVPQGAARNPEADHRLRQRHQSRFQELHGHASARLLILWTG